MEKKEGAVRRFWKREPVLCIAAVCAAVSMILNPPTAAYLNYIDWRVIALLFCLMAVVAGFQECGVFAVLAQRLLAGERNIRFVLLTLVLLPFFSAMLVTNDVALLTFVPFAVLVMNLIGQRERLIWIVVLQTLAANLGSMATPVGNPQNLYIYSNYELSAGPFFSVVLPLALLSLVGLTAACLCGKSEQIRVNFPEEAQVCNPALLPIVVAGMLLFDRPLFRKVDYGLLATFFCFFLFAGNVGACAPVQEALTRIMAENTALASGLTSQVISNVPAAVLLSGFTADWRGLLLGTNIGGLGTPIASLASLISLKAYLKSPGARLGRYLLVFTLANGAALLLLGGGAALMGLLPH